jgi:hypothetical protein
MKNERILANATAATGNFNSSSIDLTNFDNRWSLTVVRSASDGSPTVTIQASDDNSNWFDYKTESTGVSVTNGEIFMDDEFIPRFMRVAYTYGGGTGTVTIKLFKYPDIV